jgi:hypothetical protein
MKQSLPADWFPRQFPTLKIARWHAKDLRKRGIPANVHRVGQTGHFVYIEIRATQEQPK